MSVVRITPQGAWLEGPHPSSGEPLSLKLPTAVHAEREVVIPAKGDLFSLAMRFGVEVPNH